jgi:hypothetical protein
MITELISIYLPTYEFIDLSVLEYDNAEAKDCQNFDCIYSKHVIGVGMATFIILKV